jgi:hypothetical protein
LHELSFPHVPETHWASVVHDMKQLRVTRSQVKGTQSVLGGLPAWQVPVPSQVLGLLRV